MAVHFPGFTVTAEIISVELHIYWRSVPLSPHSPVKSFSQSDSMTWLVNGGRGTDNVIFSHNIWCHFRLCSTSTCHMKLNFCFFSECGTFTMFSLHNKWTGNLHKYNDGTESNRTGKQLWDIASQFQNCVAVTAHFSILSSTLIYTSTPTCSASVSPDFMALYKCCIIIIILIIISW